jgi:hypothetical protein
VAGQRHLHVLHVEQLVRDQPPRCHVDHTTATSQRSAC